LVYLLGVDYFSGWVELWNLDCIDGVLDALSMGVLGIRLCFGDMVVEFGRARVLVNFEDFHLQHLAAVVPSEPHIFARLLGLLNMVVRGKV